MRPGQILAVRTAILGLRTLGIGDPVEHRKRLITFVEIDRSATDAVRVVARDDSRAKARALFPELANPVKQPLEAYKVRDDRELFSSRRCAWPATSAAKV